MAEKDYVATAFFGAFTLMTAVTAGITALGVAATYNQAATRESRIEALTKQFTPMCAPPSAQALMAGGPEKCTRKWAEIVANRSEKNYLAFVGGFAPVTFVTGSLAWALRPRKDDGLSL